MAINLGAFLGGNQGQGGITSPIQALLQKEQQKKQQAAAFQALQQMAQQNTPGIPAPAMPGATPMPAAGGAPAPGGLNSPQGGPVPIGNPAPPPGGMPPAGGTPPAPSPGGGAGNSPRGDMMTMIGKIAGLKIPDDQKMAVLDRVGATMSPIEKYTQQLELAQTKLQGQLDMVNERQKTLLQLQQMRDTTSTQNTNTRAAATSANTTERTRHDQAMEPIAQERADTAKTGAASKVKLDTARIKALEAKVPSENKKPFQAAKDTYDRAASLYQSLTRPGASPAPAANDIAFAKQKMDAAQAKMEALATGDSATEKPAAKPAAPASAATGTPDTKQLSDKEQRSFDGGKTWWHLQDGKPVKTAE